MGLPHKTLHQDKTIITLIAIIRPTINTYEKNI